MSGGTQHGGKILIDALRRHGADRVFMVPGESFLAALDALHDTNDIDQIVCRQEGGAAMMAEAHGKLTGRPGICFVTRGPGATNASAGVHVAFQDSSPMLLLIGQVPRRFKGREAFQEVDFPAMFAPLAKWAAEVDSAERIPEFIARAWRTATSGRPGPVVLSFPEDVLSEKVSVPPLDPALPSVTDVAASALSAMRELIGAAKRPLMMVGGGGWDATAVADLRAFAEANGLPTVATFRCQDLFDNRHELYAGDAGLGINPKLAQRIKDADVILAVGARLGEMTTSGYTLIEAPKPRQALIHVHPSAEELGRVYTPILAIQSGMKAFTAAARTLAPVDGKAWSAWRKEARDDYVAWSTPNNNAGAVQMAEIVGWLNQRLPDDAIITNGAGNFSAWVHRFYRYRDFRTQVAPTSGSMGYGLPAAIAAKRQHPNRIVVGFSGDGCFMMTGQELATAVQHGIAIVSIVINNGMYGTIRMHQERTYPGRIAGTTLANPDFAALARACGAHGETVAKTEEFAPAFERALASGKPALIEVKLDPEAITHRTTLSEIRAQALKAKS